MKLKSTIIVASIILLVSSCSKEESFPGINWSTFRPGNKILLMEGPENITFTWKEENLVKMTTSSDPSYKYFYDDSNRISTIECYDCGVLEDRTDFIYDGDELHEVLCYVNLENNAPELESKHSIIYSGNRIKTIESNYYRGQNDDEIISSYTWNGDNVTKIECIDNGFITVYDIEYDSKNSPFYGCFIYGFDPVLTFRDAFSKNNYTRIKVHSIDVKGHKSDTETLQTATYTYSNDGFPMTMTVNDAGSSFRWNIFYK